MHIHRSLFTFITIDTVRPWLSRDTDGIFAKALARMFVSARSNLLRNRLPRRSKALYAPILSMRTHKIMTEDIFFCGCSQRGQGADEQALLSSSLYSLRRVFISLAQPSLAPFYSVSCFAVEHWPAGLPL